MRPLPSWIGSALLGAGLLVGVMAVLLAVFGLPGHLPALLLTIAVVKITFVGAAGLLGAGAWARRRALRERERSTALPRDSSAS